ncbi:potassium channel family protein [Terracoccus luteus]|uniref:Voltage-gated potassium channel n=1 Tax=Terracoccus luteus TaxID=53356 RepID=A0A839Q2L4_9MICO|nr:potassium channel family protein [Terracoccus luteus]MBB2988506.1 voltage-gated potassium channel [Terracoccus luteus]MCP2174147.1 voltage-gated potassium channel [Terracoccus luteus]
MRLDEWEHRTEWPLAAVAVAFLAAFAWPTLNPNLPPQARTACTVIQLAAWLAFVVDYIVRLALAPNRARFMWTHLVDLAVILLPLLRPLRLLRLVTILNVLNRGVSAGLRGRVAIYVVGATILVVFVGGLGMLDVERGQPGGNIKTPGDAWWWAITTITTVGYGERYPTSTAGRLVAVALMVCGIALIGVVTASLASWLIERIRDEQSETRLEVSDVHAQLRALRDELADLRAELARKEPPADTAATAGTAPERAVADGAAESRTVRQVPSHG